MTSKLTLGKDERLKSRKLTDQLFSTGKKFTVAPYRIHYLLNSQDAQRGIPLQFGVGVSNKNFKKAVDRNRIKRLTREVWRLQKKALYEKLKEQQQQLNIFFIYTVKELPDFKNILAVIKRIIDKLSVITEVKG